ncbi:MAG: subtype III-A CRISPR-associated protein Csm2 [Phormidium sp. OSCR]|nr:MAG: subtype III-A CRISPR-associated protein Csm2 [Phormidium sp. OSCR]
MDIQKTIIKHIDGLGSLKDYYIRDLVNHAEEFGNFLRSERLETNQVRKFLDAINQLKTELTKDNDFKQIETGVVLLKPKLAYAAARQKAAKPLSQVMSKAIDKVKTTQDFERLVQFIESIIAYHKAAGGK